MSLKFSSLKAKLALGAGLVALVALLGAALSIIGMEIVSRRIEASVQAEKRVERYSVLSTQVTSFIVVAAEAAQSGLSPEARADRLDRLAVNISDTFESLRRDHEAAVSGAAPSGLDAQSRRATQSIGLARMQALFDTTLKGLLDETAGPERLQGHIDSFAHGFDPLLNAVISEEIRDRREIIAGITDLRRQLIPMALAISAATILLLIGFYLVLIRPLFRRLDLLRDAARQIRQADFAVSLPEKDDELGHVLAETNRMARTLSNRRDEVEAEWTRLNNTIEERTEELREAVEELARTDENRRRLFADISHELRNPLSVILMESEIGLKGSDVSKESFQTIRTRALRLNRRIDDLLRLARSETGLLQLNAGPFDLGETVSEALEDMRPQVESAGMTITLSGTAAPMTQGDRNWVRQVVAGLIQNAIRHAREGGEITMTLEQKDERVCIHVTDQGPGIDPADQDRIFDRFRQGSSNTASEGFGIGLAFAKWVIEQQNGRIDLQSPLPRAKRKGPAPGTKVTLCLPVAQG